MYNINILPFSYIGVWDLFVKDKKICYFQSFINKNKFVIKVINDNDSLIFMCDEKMMIIYDVVRKQKTVTEDIADTFKRFLSVSNTSSYGFSSIFFGLLENHVKDSIIYKNKLIDKINKLPFNKAMSLNNDYLWKQTTVRAVLSLENVVFND